MTHNYKGLKKKWIAKCTVSMFLVMALLCTNTMSVFAFAATDATPKQEVVYINLDSDGTVDDVYVVNIFDLIEDGKIVDYGNYSALRNMTTSDELVFQNGTITIEAKAGKLYYEGLLDSNIIPWNFSMRYFLDGTEYRANEIAGKSGALKIKMSVRENTDCNSPFFDNYALQASFTLDTKHCENISAENATVANVGRKKQLTYTILPGKETDVVITADVTDFEMDGIAINGVPLSMDIDVSIGDHEELNELKNGASKLDDGANSLKSGTQDLQSGAESLNDGTSALLVGSDELNKGSEELSGGAGNLNDSLAKLLEGGSTLDNGIADAQAGALTVQNGAAVLKDGATNMLDGVHVVSDGLQLLSAQNEALLSGAYTVFQQLTKQAELQLNQTLAAMGLPAVTLTPETYQDVLNGLLAALDGGSQQQASPTATAIPSVSANLPYEQPSETAILALQSQLNDYNNFYRGLQGYTNGVQSAASGSLSLADAADALLSGTTDLQEGTKGLYDGLVVLKQGGTELVDGTKAVMEGTNELYNGTVTLSDGTMELKNGMTELLNGLTELHNGIITLHDGTIELSDGTLELRDRTSDLEGTMNDKITSEIDDMMGAGFEPVSFVSDQNTKVEFVQFVVKTDGISILETEAAIEAQNEPLTFWQKLFKLFGWE